MKTPLLILFVTVSIFADSNISCRGCAAGKSMLQCDYYVAKKGEKDKRHFCEIYAKVVDIDGASAKAAWYYLLAGKPHKALSAADKALQIGQHYAQEYRAFALWILKKPKEARQALEAFRRKGGGGEYLLRDLRTLERLYPEIDFTPLRSGNFDKIRKKGEEAKP